MKMIKKDVDELEGDCLDWAVAKAIGLPMSEDVNNYHPSRNWSQGGPLLDEYNIDFSSGSDGHGNFAGTEACSMDFMTMQCSCVDGPTRLIAAMRAIVLRKVGENIEIPSSLT